MTHNYVVIFRNGFKVAVYLSDGSRLLAELREISESMRCLCNHVFFSFDMEGKEHPWVANLSEVMAVIPVAFYPEQ
jgi:hypothetical protein